MIRLGIFGETGLGKRRDRLPRGICFNGGGGGGLGHPLRAQIDNLVGAKTEANRVSGARRFLLAIADGRVPLGRLASEEHYKELRGAVKALDTHAELGEAARPAFAKVVEALRDFKRGPAAAAPAEPPAAPAEPPVAPAPAPLPAPEVVDVAGLNATIAGLEEELKTTRAQLDAAKKDLGPSQEIARAAQETIGKHEATIARLGRELKAAQAAAQAEQKRLDAKIRELEARPVADPTELQRLRKESSDQTAKVVSLLMETAKIAGLEKDIAALKGQLEDAVRENRTLTSQLEAANGRLEAAGREVEELKRAVEATKGALEEVRGENKVLKDRLEAAEGKLAAARREVDELKAFNALLEAPAAQPEGIEILEIAETTPASEPAKQPTIQERLGEIAAELSGLKGQIEEANQALITTRAERDQANNNLSSQNSALERTRARAAELKRITGERDQAFADALAEIDKQLTPLRQQLAGLASPDLPSEPVLLEEERVKIKNLESILQSKAGAGETSGVAVTALTKRIASIRAEALKRTQAAAAASYEQTRQSLNEQIAAQEKTRAAKEDEYAATLDNPELAAEYFGAVDLPRTTIPAMEKTLGELEQAFKAASLKVAAAVDALGGLTQRKDALVEEATGIKTTLISGLDLAQRILAENVAVAEEGKPS